MKNKRTRQLGELLKSEISDIIRKRVKDPRVGFVTVTEVNLSNDLKHALVRISVMGSDHQKTETIQGLQNAHAFIQKEIASRIRLRYIPVLTFQLDTRYDDYERIDKILQKLEIGNASSDIVDV
ncbi:30S ribosome-binding factor RbfA [bacterium]|nr:30S ribosome-binding factor RbfA [bacterium]